MNMVKNPAKITIRVIVLSIFFTILSVLWIRQVEIIAFTCQISESIPPIPAIAVLLFLSVLYPGLKFIAPKLVLSPQELVYIYVFVTIGSIMSGVGVMQAFLPYLTAPIYFATPENKFHLLTQHLPRWLVPQGMETIRTFYEGADTGKVPWDKWLIPGIFWLLLFFLFWWTAFCLWCIFRRQWSENEKLAYPLVNIPLSFTDGNLKSTEHGGRTFIRNPLTWVGFALAGIYQGLNILNAINPNVPCLGTTFPLGTLFTEPPLDCLRHVEWWYRPELVGLGYFVSTEILFSVWFFYWLANGITLIVNIFGIRVPGFPFMNEQGIGAYLGVAGIIIYLARRYLIQIGKNVFYGKFLDTTNEPIKYTWSVWGFIVGFTGLVTFTSLAGVSVWVSIFFFLILFTFILVYGHVRAETGTPSIWMLPHSQLKYLPFYTFGAGLFQPGGSIQSISVWTMFFFLLHGGFYSQATVYQLESFKLAEEVGISRRRISIICFIALLFGLVTAFIMFLVTYYDYGANVLAGGKVLGGTGGIRILYSLGAWNDTNNLTHSLTPPNWIQNSATVVGIIIVTLLSILRRLILNVPFHPVGYLIATNIGTQVWAAFFSVWVIKSLILKYGGVKTYQKMIPFFIALAIGQYFFVGVVWSIIAQWFPDAHYLVWFT